MELDDIKKQSEDLDGKLEAALCLNRRALDERVLETADRAIRRHRWALAASLVMGVVSVLLTGSFVADHVHETRFLVPGLVLHIFVIAQIGVRVAQIVHARQIDHAAPIVEVQKRIEVLRISSLRTTMWTLLLAPLLWTPLFIVALQGCLDVDGYTALGVPYIVANVVFGLAVIAAALHVARAHSDRFAGSPFGRRLLRDIGGSNLAEATDVLESLTRYEQNDSQN